jgi:hypothetical protein
MIMFRPTLALMISVDPERAILAFAAASIVAGLLTMLLSRIGR